MRRSLLNYLVLLASLVPWPSDANDSLRPALIERFPDLAAENFRETLPDDIYAPQLQKVREELDVWAADPENQQMLEEARFYSELLGANPQLKQQAYFLTVVWRANRYAASTPAARLRYKAWVDVDGDGFITPLDLNLARLRQRRSTVLSTARKLGVILPEAADALPAGQLEQLLQAAQDHYARLAAHRPTTAAEQIYKTHYEQLRQALNENRRLGRLLFYWRLVMQRLHTAQVAVERQVGWWPVLPIREVPACPAQSLRQLLAALLQPDQHLAFWQETEPQNVVIFYQEITPHIAELQRTLDQLALLEGEWRCGQPASLSSLNTTLSAEPLTAGAAFCSAQSQRCRQQQDWAGDETALIGLVNWQLWDRPANSWQWNHYGLLTASTSALQQQLAQVHRGQLPAAFQPEANLQLIAALVDVLETLQTASDVPDHVAAAHNLFTWFDMPLRTTRQWSVPNAVSSEPVALDRRLGRISVGDMAMHNAAVSAYGDEFTARFHQHYEDTMEALAKSRLNKSYKSLEAEHNANLAFEQQCADKLQSAERHANANPKDQEAKQALEQALQIYEAAGEQRLQSGQLLVDITSDESLQDFILAPLEADFMRQTGRDSTTNPRRVEQIERYLGLLPEHRWLAWVVGQLDQLPSWVPLYNVYPDHLIDQRDVNAAADFLYRALESY